MSRTSATSNLRLHPWRDGVDHCLRLMETPVNAEGSSFVTAIRRGQFTHSAEDNTAIRSVDVCFHDADYQVGISHKLKYVELFQAIGRLPNLESLIVRFTRGGNESFKLTRQGIPPVSALKAALSSATYEEYEDEPTSNILHQKASAVQLAYLTLIGLPLFGDDYDFNGWVELLRIHPSLQSIVIKDCIVSKPKHLEQLRQVLVSQELPRAQDTITAIGSQQRRHVELLQNTFLDISKLPATDDGSRSWWSICFGCCM